MHVSESRETRAARNVSVLTLDVSPAASVVRSGFMKSPSRSGMSIERMQHANEEVIAHHTVVLLELTREVAQRLQSDRKTLHRLQYVDIIHERDEITLLLGRHDSQHAQSRQHVHQEPHLDGFVSAAVWNPEAGRRRGEIELIGVAEWRAVGILLPDGELADVPGESLSAWAENGAEEALQRGWVDVPGARCRGWDVRCCTCGGRRDTGWRGAGIGVW